MPDSLGMLYPKERHGGEFFSFVFSPLFPNLVLKRTATQKYQWEQKKKNLSVISALFSQSTRKETAKEHRKLLDYNGYTADKQHEKNWLHPNLYHPRLRC